MLRYHFEILVSRNPVCSWLCSAGLCKWMFLQHPCHGYVCAWDHRHSGWQQLCYMVSHNQLERCSGGSFHRNCLLQSLKWRAWNYPQNGHLVQGLHSHLPSDHL